MYNPNANPASNASNDEIYWFDLLYPPVRPSRPSVKVVVKKEKDRLYKRITRRTAY